eukprot:TRINITY_DN3446_c0_g2_i1.p2 TRINITY_DN3446_c0_g2~~TRINITY_DN3446_c0_g2_i1.p2  ORF type:complete len:255 (-),score=65.41 TRINITY_DN3446_c0_g2_i1:1083-1796(-)
MSAPESIKKREARKTVAADCMKKRKARTAASNKKFLAEVVKRSRASHQLLSSSASQEDNKRSIAKAFGNYYVPAEAKIAFVTRIRGICDVPPKERKILQLLRLRQIHNGVFVRLTKAMHMMLNRVNPYIAWGYPSVATIRKLLLKRGYAKINGQRTKIVSNHQIRAALGDKNIVCLEDLVYQIATAGPKFRDVTRFLWPFKLSAPRGGFSAKRKHYVEGGDYGNREEYVNRLVLRML